MSDEPIVDGRTREELFAELTSVASTYTPEWNPYTEDSGTTLLHLFARFGTDVTKRLDSVPDKHRFAFIDALDFAQWPPQSARVPVTFTTTADIDTNVVIPGGTQVTAETADGDTEIFEIPRDAGFEATPATLRAVYTVDPRSDRIVDQSAVVDPGEETTLFEGHDRQEHGLYLCHADSLNLDSGSTLIVTLGTNASVERISARVRWEYYGEDEEGTPGWHALPEIRPEAEETAPDEASGLRDFMEAVRSEIRELFEEESGEPGDGPHTLLFQLPGPTVDHTVAGVEGRWIRGLTTDEEGADAADDGLSPFDIEIDSVRLDIGQGADDGVDRIRPERLYTNDVPLSVDDGDFYPLGRVPLPPTALYLSSEDALTKRGATVSLEFVGPEDGDDEGPGSGEETDTGRDEDDAQRRPTALTGLTDGPPEISWEYWNGSGWTRLALASDGTESFTRSGEVSFTVPADVEAMSFSGHESRWIRARLVSGHYGLPQYEITTGGERGDLIRQPTPPVYSDVTLRYEQRNEPFETVLTHNSLMYRDVSPAEQDRSFAPFVPPPEETQTLYLGFDASLSDGPISVHVPVVDEAYPGGFDPSIRWEYCTNPETLNWRKLDAQDGTEGLTERGIVSLSFPEATAAFELFGERRHWIRATVTGDAFDVGPSGPVTSDGAGDRSVELNSPASRESGPPPTLEGVYPNTQLAYNERTIEEEVLGSSDGSSDQTFGCEQVPVTDAEVWVDESGALSRAERRELEASQPDDVRRESASGNGTDEFWVRWTEVSDFLDSDESSRHYRIHHASGTIRFGDGQRGAIPPVGERNVVATYRTGGGSDGNVAAGSITELRTPVPLVDAVTNVVPGDGGADVESLERVATRASGRIRNRGRAVSAADFEQVAREASRQLARVTCEPGMDVTGEGRPGWVTLLIVPHEQRDRPTASLELRERVKHAVADRAPATLVAGDRQRIVVRGPDYVTVSVETTVETRGVESITKLKRTIEGTLNDYFHPLTGGRDGEGWAFGTAPRLSQLAPLVESTPGVDRVGTLTMTVTRADEEVIIRDPAERPVLARDEMISSGTHEVTVVMTGRP